MKLFEKLLCKHKWKVHSEVATERIGTQNIVQIKQTLICEVCGKIKQIKL